MLIYVRHINVSCDYYYHRLFADSAFTVLPVDSGGDADEQQKDHEIC